MSGPAPSHLLSLVIVGFALLQQIGSVDLTRPVPPSPPHERPAPPGCKKLSEGVIADGWPEPEDHKPRRIVVTVLSVNNVRPALGTEVEAVVELRNRDKNPIEIPWSTDPNIIGENQSPNADYLQWDGGTFEFTLRGKEGHQVRLQSLTEWLHGSKFVSGTQLTIQPGQSITATVKFKLEDRFSIEPLRLKEGNWQLRAEWSQVGRTLHVIDCGAWNGFFHYDHFYEQENVPFGIQITTKDAANYTAR